MTLKEKLCEPFGGLKTDTSNKLEIIANDFAIGFSEWIVDNELFYTIRYARVETNKLLEMYKKEKGL